jgi:hypothetical protein
MILSTRKVIAVGLLVVMVLLVAFLLRPAHTVTTNVKPKGSANAPACSLPTSPCIKITQQDGVTYRLNDFRFVPGHCVIFISLPDGVHRESCGNYKLDWIGPGRDV